MIAIVLLDVRVILRPLYGVETNAVLGNDAMDGRLLPDT